jgi:biopolymer transport protein ExbD
MPDAMTLQITSMADIFTIILVFLLKSTATSAVNISPVNGMKIPQGEFLDAPVEALKVEISENSIQVESKSITTLQDFRFDPQDINADLTSKSVRIALEKERKRQELIAQSNPNVKIDSKILIIADQRVPYTTIKSVLASSAVNGFTDFKLVAVNKQ